MRCLEIAYQGQTGWLLELQVNPAYHDLHSDARYQELIRRIGLPLLGGRATEVVHRSPQ
jgi:hypothetical protein